MTQGPPWSLTYCRRRYFFRDARIDVPDSLKDWDQIVKGPARDMVHLYAHIRAQCEKDLQPRMTYVDLIRIKGRWHVDFGWVPKQI